MRPLRDWRVIAPAAVAALVFAWRARPAPPPAPLPRPAAVTLPLLRGAPEPKVPQTYALVAERSTARFCLADGETSAFVACPGLQGELELRPDGTGSLDLTLDLGTLAPLHGAAIDVPGLLSIHRGDAVRFRGDLVANSRLDLPGCRQLTFVGELHLCPVRHRQALQFWLVTLPAVPPRLLGHGPVPGRDLHLHAADDPTSAMITLGLHLAFTRRRDR
jgi:hypothetical protein